MLTFLLFFIFQTTNINQVQLQFDKANEFLNQQDYQKAILQYREIEKTPYQSGPLYLNMALSYLQLDSLGKAKAYFYKASEFDLTKEEALKGVEYVINNLPQKAARLPKMPWDYILEWTLTLGASVWSLLTVIFLYTSLLLIFVFWFLNRDSNWLIRGSILILLMSIGAGAAALYSEYVLDRYASAVMVVEESEMMSAATESSEMVGISYEGYEFRVDYKLSVGNPDWYYVRMSNGVYGWVRKSELVII